MRRVIHTPLEKITRTAPRTVAFSCVVQTTVATYPTTVPRGRYAVCGRLRRSRYSRHSRGVQVRSTVRRSVCWMACLTCCGNSRAEATIFSAGKTTVWYCSMSQATRTVHSRETNSEYTTAAFASQLAFDVACEAHPPNTATTNARTQSRNLFNRAMMNPPHTRNVVRRKPHGLDKYAFRVVSLTRSVDRFRLNDRQFVDNGTQYLLRSRHRHGGFSQIGIVRQHECRDCGCR